MELSDARHGMTANCTVWNVFGTGCLIKIRVPKVIQSGGSGEVKVQAYSYFFKKKGKLGSLSSLYITSEFVCLLSVNKSSALSSA